MNYTLKHQHEWEIKVTNNVNNLDNFGESANG